MQLYFIIGIIIVYKRYNKFLQHMCNITIPTDFVSILNTEEYWLIFGCNNELRIINIKEGKAVQSFVFNKQNFENIIGVPNDIILLFKPYARNQFTEKIVPIDSEQYCTLEYL